LRARGAEQRDDQLLPASTMSIAWEFTSSKLVNVMPAAIHRSPLTALTQGGLLPVMVPSTVSGAVEPPNTLGWLKVEVGSTSTNGNVATWSIVGSVRLEL
jgi:hypothetical protein